MATFVLVHGAWAGAVIWRPIASRLREAGHEVYTPTLTGIGERRHLLNREIDLATHIQDVLGVIDYEELTDIVLVGHSYGGMVVTGVADAVPEKIGSLVFLDAFVPENGQSLFDLLPPDRPHTTTPGQEWLTAPLPVEAFGAPSPQVRDFVTRKGMSQPTACFSQPVQLRGGIDRVRRKTYIYCNDPSPTAFTGFYERLRKRPDWIVSTLPCTHFVQIDMPEELTAMLQKAAP
jgi:pimeloyl-ACP methyl ester carboxylesterase